MANMSYCRFQNTAGDLQGCLEHMDDDIGEEEARARKQLVRLCMEVVQQAQYQGLIGFDLDDGDDWP